jgi:peptidoglycan-associated lipoprotein
VATVTTGGVDGQACRPSSPIRTSILSKRSVYFDYDNYEVKAEYKDLVAAHAKFLTENRQFKMLIQGNTDERGSREYNLALGQKRADAVKKMLSLLGAREDQLEAVSLGEEKPKNEGQNEAAWAENRRGDMLYSGEF